MPRSAAPTTRDEPAGPVEAAVLIVSYNSRHHLDDCLRSVLASDDGEIGRHVVVVDNASRDGSAAFVREQFPQVDLVELDGNLGFAGGNNAGLEHIRRRYPATAYLALLNPDTIVRSGWLGELVAYLRLHDDTAAVQAKLLMHPQSDRFNSAGNRCHFLGFGFVTACGQEDSGQYDEPRAVDFASGAAMLVDARRLAEVGLFDERMFLYLEDTDLAWKLRIQGWAVAYAPSSVVYHKYAFDKNYRFYFYFERNRLYLVLIYYRLATLLLLMPALLAMELCQCLFALGRGLLGDRLRAYGWLLSPGNQAVIRARRRQAQALRRLSEREFMGGFAGRIEHAAVAGLARLVDAAFAAYWAVARRLIFW